MMVQTLGMRKAFFVLNQLAFWMLNLGLKLSSNDVNQKSNQSKFGFLWNLNVGCFTCHIKFILGNTVSLLMGAHWAMRRRVSSLIHSFNKFCFISVLFFFNYMPRSGSVVRIQRKDYWISTQVRQSRIPKGMGLKLLFGSCRV